MSGAGIGDESQQQKSWCHRKTLKMAHRQNCKDAAGVVKMVTALKGKITLPQAEGVCVAFCHTEDPSLIGVFKGMFEH